MQEACFGARLDGFPVSLKSFALGAFGSAGADPAEARIGASIAEESFRHVVRPFDLSAGSREAVDVFLGTGGGSGEVDADALSQRIDTVLEDVSSPLAAAIRTAALVSVATGGRHPAAERLTFISAEHTARHRDRARPGGPVFDHRRSTVADPAAHLPWIDGRWIALPASAAIVAGRVSWSLTAPAAVEEIAAGLRRHVDTAMGKVPILDRWRDTSRRIAADMHGKSRLGDLVSLLIERPVITSPVATNVLGVTRRTGINILRTAEEAGIVRLMTNRERYRVWAVTPLAEIMEARTSRAASATRAVAPRSSPDPAPAPPPAARSPASRSPADPDPDLEKAYADLDAALSNIDKVISGLTRS